MLKIKRKNIALGGIIAALTVVFLYLTNVMPTGKIALVAVAGFFIGVAIIEAGVANALWIYIVSSILSCILVPNLGFMYILIGSWGIIKYYIEKIKNPVISNIVKFASFVVIALLLLFVLYYVLGSVKINIDIRQFVERFGDFSQLAFLGIMVLAFVVYDFAFTQAMKIYMATLYKKIIK